MANTRTDNSNAEHAPPGTVEMPRSTSWPIVLATGVTLIMLGAATSVVFCYVGGVLLACALAGWISQLLPGQGHEFEPLAAAGDRPKPVVARPGTVETLKPGVVGYRFQLPEKVHPVSAGIRGGIVGGLAMTVPALVWGVLSGHGIWFPVNLLAGMVLPGMGELSMAELEQFRMVWLVIGVAIHVVMSISIGLVYGVILPTLPPVPGGPLVFGGIVLPAIWTSASYTLMGVVNPVLHDFVEWPWFVASQFVFGVAASIVIMLSEKIPIAPRGPGADEGEPSAPAGWLGCIAFALLLFSGCNDNLPGKPLKRNEYRMPDTITGFTDLYAVRCAACHGANGTLGAGPPLNDPLFLSLVTERELLNVISNGRKGTGKETLMPAWSQSNGGPLTQQQIESLVDGIKKRAWDASESKTQSTAELPANAPPLLAPSDLKGDVERGRKVFATACAGCHGDKGQGLDEGPGAVNNVALLTLMSDTLLRRIIITGRPDLGMPNFHDSDGRDSSFKPLTSEEIADLVALLQHWREGSTNGEQ